MIINRVNHKVIELAKEQYESIDFIVEGKTYYNKIASVITQYEFKNYLRGDKLRYILNFEVKDRNGVENGEAIFVFSETVLVEKVEKSYKIINPGAMFGESWLWDFYLKFIDNFYEDVHGHNSVSNGFTIRDKDVSFDQYCVPRKDGFIEYEVIYENVSYYSRFFVDTNMDTIIIDVDIRKPYSH